MKYETLLCFIFVIHKVQDFCVSFIYIHLKYVYTLCSFLYFADRNERWTDA